MNDNELWLVISWTGLNQIPMVLDHLARDQQGTYQSQLAAVLSYGLCIYMFINDVNISLNIRD